MKDFIIKVYDEESGTTTTVSGSGDIEVVKKELEDEGWVYVSHIEVEVD